MAALSITSPPSPPSLSHLTTTTLFRMDSVTSGPDITAVKNPNYFDKKEDGSTIIKLRVSSKSQPRRPRKSSSFVPAQKKPRPLDNVNDILARRRPPHSASDRTPTSTTSPPTTRRAWRGRDGLKKYNGSNSSMNNLGLSVTNSIDWRVKRSLRRSGRRRYPPPSPRSRRRRPRPRPPRGQESKPMPYSVSKTTPGPSVVFFPTNRDEGCKGSEGVGT